VTPDLHPLNRAFAWRATQGPFRRIDQAQARSWNEGGYFLLEDAFDAASVRGVLDEIDPLEARMTEVLRERHGGSAFIADADAITFTVHLVKRSPRLREFCASRVFRELARDLVGPDVRLYWDQAVYKKPDKPRPFHWHQDNGYTYLEPQAYLTCWVALTDATIENGCPWVVPGLHTRGTLKHWLTDTGWQCLDAPEGAIPVPARAGSIVVFSSLTPHRTGPNLSDAVRKAYIVQFAPDGARMVRRNDDGTETTELQSDPTRQFSILRGGEAA
jgi:ectoine hydroxylase-related dioxygenase (phytanoyl-CoA dioxygenase family)